VTVASPLSLREGESSSARGVARSGSDVATDNPVFLLLGFVTLVKSPQLKKKACTCYNTPLTKHFGLQTPLLSALVRVI
jgi:hypothetical protein